MDDQETQLRQHLKAVLQSSDGSKAWRQAMNRFLVFLQNLPEFKRYARPDCPAYFLDALNKTWEWVSRELRAFKPRTDSVHQDLVRWVNGYLYWRIKDGASQNLSIGLSLDQPMGNDESGAISTWLDRIANSGEIVGKGFIPPSFSGLDAYIAKLQTEATQAMGLALETYIEQDPEQKLQKSHLRQHPECNSQMLAQRILLKHPPDKLTDIARDFNANYQTLTSHWKLKTLPLLRDLAIEFGYQSPENL
jgi:hypothetical protein